MLNSIIVQGRLAADVTLRYTQSGAAVASFTVAVDRDFQPKDGGEKQTDFINVVAWRSTGEFVSKYFSKGSMIVVAGRLQMRDRTDREGNKHTSAEVVADRVYFGGSKRDNDLGGYGQPEGYNASGSSYSVPVTQGFQEIADENSGGLPF